MVILTQIFESWTVTIIGSSLSGQEIKFYGITQNTRRIII